VRRVLAVNVEITVDLQAMTSRLMSQNGPNVPSSGNDSPANIRRNPDQPISAGMRSFAE
jgi:hypothetical protein